MEQMERQTSADFLSHGCAGAQPFLIPIPATQSLSSRAESQGGRRSQICHPNSLLYSTYTRYGFVITQHFLAQTNCSKVKEWKLRPKPRTFVGTFAFAPFHSSRKIRLSASQPDPLLQSATCSLFFRSLASLHNIVLKQKTHKWNINRLHIPLSGAIQK